jgi:Flp pilus assembly pilin Flp
MSRVQPATKAVLEIRMHVLRRLWKEDTGAIVSSELILVATLLVIGIVTGLSSVRTAVVTELGDWADGIGAVNQSFSFGGTTGHHSATSASAFTDAPDACDDVGANCTQTGNTSHCLQVCTAPHTPG